MFYVGQVREAIGVTLSVLCSNIRLYASSHPDHSHEGGNSDVNYQHKEGSWVKFLIERASELVMNIQNTSQSDNLETTTDARDQNGHLNGDSKDDVKWMETVLNEIVSIESPLTNKIFYS
jgi:proteasome activator subunit 4